ncbi:MULTISPECIES: acylphosphatase [unclassified Pseudonocardia]|uniref:acylphosphatase n=1 Tax=unclassified Pseudonocardia TaxID=2619320 RepID=UPI000B0D6E5F|nr:MULTISPECIES: acylphosphatase [unclassified Pseudonocardia]
MTGIVQGVGFRPFVYRAATGLGLSGFVGNDERGVLIEAEGPAGALDELLRLLREQAPPLAVVGGVLARSVPPRGGTGFTIAASTAAVGSAATLISPDTATCSHGRVWSHSVGELSTRCPGRPSSESCRRIAPARVPQACPFPPSCAR